MSIPNLAKGSFFSGFVMHPGMSKYSESVRVVLIQPSMTFEFSFDESNNFDECILLKFDKTVAAVAGLKGLALWTF